MVLDFIEILKVIFLGIVEGITEWLPISSTGHMILVDEFITLNMSEAFKEMFFVVIQLGAILAVVVMFWNKMFPFQFKNKAQSIVKKDTFSLWFKVAVKNPVLIAPSFQKSGTVDSCRTVPVGSIHLLGDYTLLTNQVKAASHRMATRP